MTESVGDVRECWGGEPKVYEAKASSPAKALLLLAYIMLEDERDLLGGINVYWNDDDGCWVVTAYC